MLCVQCANDGVIAMLSVSADDALFRNNTNPSSWQLFYYERNNNNIFIGRIKIPKRLCRVAEIV